VQIDQLWLQDFRTYEHLELTLPPGLTCVVGRNGIGKTNLLEAVGYASTLESFRHADSAAMVRVGAPRAIVRAAGMGLRKDVLVETEIRPQARGRTQLNRKRLTRTGDLLERLKVSVFAPDDLTLIKGSPGERRVFLDEGIVLLDHRYDATRRDLGRVIKQRNALLRGAKGRLNDETRLTLDVFDERLAALGETLGAARLQLLSDLTPFVQQAYETLSAPDAESAVNQNHVNLTYQPAWLDEGLHAALERTRASDVQRGVTQVGPHRDDLAVLLSGLPSRSHASQGEQRSLALALRLGIHLLATDRFGTPPILILDDVFSELDSYRSSALFAAIPPGQTLLSTAVKLPPAADPDLTLSASPGTVTPL